MREKPKITISDPTEESVEEDDAVNRNLKVSNY